MKAARKELEAESHLFGNNSGFVEALYEQYLSAPESVPPPWRTYFDRLGNGQGDIRHSEVRERFRRLAQHQGAVAGAAPAAEKQAAVLKLVNAYRLRGHQNADLDPLGLTDRPSVPDLALANQGLSEADLDTVFNTGSMAAPDEMKLRDIVALLEKVYCRQIGAEYMHITDTQQRRWMQQRLEGSGGDFGLDQDAQIAILRGLTAAEGLEKYLHTKYVGQKRFSLEGAEALIPMLSQLVRHAGKGGVREIVLGMAHRGRLNVLVNLLGKSPRELFEEFEGKSADQDPQRTGDVKYHLGFSSDLETEDGTVHLALGFNPSHLEIIDPVVVGSARARQARRGEDGRNEVLPILIHGDAAFAGQGVVMELFNMSQARGFEVGGTFHVIVNNQIGFTTSNPLDARSTLYCTEVAKMVQAPILHVNADHPEAVHFCMQVAHDFLQTFHKDVVVDLVCYRRHGHNEADEPAATQPVMYETIRSLPTVREKYVSHLLETDVLDDDKASELVDQYRDALDRGEPVAEARNGEPEGDFSIDWSPFFEASWDQQVDTSMPAEKLRDLAEKLLELPDGFELHSRVQRIMGERAKMARGEARMDWGFAETLAYATLIDQEYGLRLVGQDSGRGTFFHRHARLVNQDNSEVFYPLAQLEKRSDRPVTIIDSLLSEEAVLGFEYGFASSDPHTLVIWEAQFGDFVNGAQVVIDQFISSGEAKWGRLCGLVMFLPHGYEGQGPEHSSARLERFMQLCARNNMQVCIPTTPAQMFHMLRRQMLRDFRKPLIVMTPKSLLRHKASTSVMDDLAAGGFQIGIDDGEIQDQDQAQRLVLCAGKVYYDLLAERDKREISDIPLIRIEQLYPFPRDWLTRTIARYPDATEIVWCQEEPMNQGAWYQIKHHLQYCLDDSHTLLYVGRESSPSPAVGRYQTHLQQQKKLVNEALSPGEGVELFAE